MPATRPCLFATVPSAMCTGTPATRWCDSQQSPTAQTPSADVRCRRSTRIAPFTPTARPASAARSAFGTTPEAEHDHVGRDRSPPATTAPSSTDSSGVSSRTSMPSPSSAPTSGAATSASRDGISCADGLDQRDVEAALHERLGHLEPDVAAAHHHDRVPVAVADLGLEAGRVVERLDAVDHRSSIPGQVGPHGPGARGDVQRVEPDAHRALARARPTPRPRGRRGRWPAPRGPGARRCRAGRGTSRGCGRRGRRGRRPTRRPGTGSRRPSSSSTAPSRPRRSPGRAAGAAPAWRRSCRRRPHR